MRRNFLLRRLALIVPTCAGVAGSAGADLPPETAVPQKQRTAVEMKLDSQILYALRRQRGDQGKDIPQEIDLAIRADGRVLVDIEVQKEKQAAVLVMQQQGQIVRSVPGAGSVRAWVPLERMGTLAESDLVRFIQRAAGAETRR